MSILIDDRSRVIVQGFTGREGTFHARQMIEYGTHVAGGVTPGKGGQSHLDRPVFDTVEEAVRRVSPDVSIIFVPAPSAADAILEAALAGVELIVCITEGIPVADMVRVKNFLRTSRSRLIGPELPGNHIAGEIEGRDHAVPDPPAGRSRRRFPFRHSDIRGGRSDHRTRPRPVHLHRHRGRPAYRQFVHRHAGVVREGRSDRGRNADRRNRGDAGGGRREVRPRSSDQAGRFVHRRTNRSCRKENGARRRHHFGGQGDGGKKNGRAPGERHLGGREPGRDRSGGSKRVEKNRSPADSGECAMREGRKA